MNLLIDIIEVIIFPGFIFSIIMGLFLTGIDRKIVARMQRRRGPKLTIAFHDFAKLLGKDTIVPRNANVKLFMLAPILALVSIGIAPIFIPIFDYSISNNIADIIVIIYLLLIPAVAMIVGGVSSGSPLSSIGVSREVVTIIAYELPLIIAIISICKKAGLILGTGTTYSFTNIIEAQKLNGNFLFTISLVPAAIAMMMILPAKVGVSPFDQAEAETEICEGPIAEYSGLYLGLFKIVHGTKAYVLSALFTSLFIGGVGVTLENELLTIAANSGIYIILVIIISIICLSIIRGLMARYKTNQMFKFYWTVPTALSILSYILVTLKI